MTSTRELIIKKRDGHELAQDDIARLVQGFTSGAIPDYQMSALLMATTLRGMTTGETSHLLEAMICSGSRFDWRTVTNLPIADKHSTGGVGDKTSFLVLPLLIAAGCRVPMVAGRGLGHTGGTLDKFESLDGLTTTLSASEMTHHLKHHGGFLAGQSDDFVPADKRIYALRDVTGTVESIPLIVSSILSKKLAAGVQHLVMDVKTGDGAFMRSFEDAKSLARALVDVSLRYGAVTLATVTDMNTPLGSSVGNAVEIEEVLDILEGHVFNDVADLSLDLGARIAAAVRGPSADLGECRDELKRHLASGVAREIFFRIATSQGAKLEQLERRDRTWLDKGTRDLPIALPEVHPGETRYLSGVRTRDLAIYLTVLGAGRVTLESKINPRVGLRSMVPLGTPLSRGQPVAFLRVPMDLDVDVRACASFFETSTVFSSELQEKATRQRNRCLEWITPDKENH
jgi:pyrimidine-nucleoside phosphorylase